MKTRNALLIRIGIIIVWMTFFAFIVKGQTAGSLDPAFGAGGKVTTDFNSDEEEIHEIALQPDGKIIVAGASSGNAAIARYHADGTPDDSFGTTGITKFSLEPLVTIAYSVVVQPDSKILISGIAIDTAVYQDVRLLLARYHSNGTIDSNFGTGGYVLFGSGLYNEAYSKNSVCLQSDQKIVVGSMYGNLFSNIRYFNVTRWNESGSIDTTFADSGLKIIDPFIGFGMNDIHDVIVQTDGKIVAAGTGDSKVMLARFNANGTTDSTFHEDGISTNGTISYQTATSINLLPDGKMICAGYWSDIPDHGVCLMRFKSNGELDSAFAVNGSSYVDYGTDEVYAFAAKLQSDGRLAVAGELDPATGNRMFFLARFLIDGSTDSSFGGSGYVTTGFPGLSARANALLIQPEGKIIAGGVNYPAFATSDFALARYIAETATFISSNSNDDDSCVLFPNPAKNNITFRLNQPYAGNLTVSFYDIIGNLIENSAITINGNEALLNTSNLTNGIYVLQIFNENSHQVFSKKFVIAR